jgi:hypothetical protein
MNREEPIKLTRDCEVVQIPEGFRVRVARGTIVRIMQSLGDTYTVMTEYGTMVRIEGKDADALGLQLKQDSGEQANEKLTAEQVKERAWGALRSVFDPEIPVNVVDSSAANGNPPAIAHPVSKVLSRVLDVDNAVGCHGDSLMDRDHVLQTVVLNQLRQAAIGAGMGFDADNSSLLTDRAGEAQSFLTHARAHIHDHIARLGCVSPMEIDSGDLVESRKVQPDVRLVVSEVPAGCLVHPYSVIVEDALNALAV